MPIRTLRVSQLNDYIAGCLDHDPILRQVRVEAEISNFRVTSSGHAYFALKDDQALIRCVCFQTALAALSFAPRDGDRVSCDGYVSLYRASGSLQLYVQDMRQTGAGDLYARFLERKQTLDAQGYFSPVRKRVLPTAPRTIAVVTSASGAVIHDICRVAWRRNPGQRILLFPARVQGDGAAEAIAQGIQVLNECAQREAIDVIIVARGGGSFEDLFAFNELVVADAIYHSEIPIVSAVGHETDFTIADFVADERAPTPSAAAERCTIETTPARDRLQTLVRRAYTACAAQIQSARTQAATLARSRGLTDPAARIDAARQRMEYVHARIQSVGRHVLDSKRNAITALAVRLDGAGPLATLRRGFALVHDADGTLFTTARDITDAQPDELVLRFADGVARVAVHTWETSK